MAVLFTVAGVLHFVFPAMYAKIVPPYLPSPRLLVAVSGVAEIAGGLGMLWPVTRRAAGWGLIALLIAVLPANIYMGWALWFRVPMQAVLIWWVWWASRTGYRH